MGRTVVLFLALSAFGPSLSQGLEVVVGSLQAQDLTKFGQQVKSFFQQEFHPASDYLKSANYWEPSKITLTFARIPANRQPAHTTDLPHNRILAHIDYYRANQNDYLSLYREMIHIIQQNRKCPEWIYQGIADYMMYYFLGPRYHDQAAVSPPTKPESGEHYSDGDRPAAYFLKWLSDHKSNNTVQWLAGACRSEGDYSDVEVEHVLGKSWDELWKEMMQPPKFTVHIDYSIVPEKKERALEFKMYLEDLHERLRGYYETDHFPDWKDMTVILVDSFYHKEFPANRTIFVPANVLNFDSFENRWHSYLFPRLFAQCKNMPTWLTDGLHWVAYFETGEKPWPADLLGYYKGNTVSQQSYFLHWVDQHYQVSGRKVTFWLNQYCFDGSYNEQTFRILTGKTSNQLKDDFVSGRNQNMAG